MVGATATGRAVVVGAGPNGLAAAVVLARAGMEVEVLEAAETIGGGARTSELFGDGTLHDHCSAVHPLAVASPVFRSLGLERHGLEWCLPEVDLAHPLDDGPGGVLLRSLDDTAAGLGEDGQRWRRLVGAAASGFDELNPELMRPLWHLPRRPLRFAAFGARAALPATVVSRAFRTERARALFAGIAAHSIQPLSLPTTAAIGVTLAAAGHRHGWPVPRGGSGAITAALGAALAEAGGRITCGVRVDRLEQVGPAEVVMLDLSPAATARICGDRLPTPVRRAYERWRYGPGAHKVDFVVEGGVPWRDEAARRAGTVHVGGTFEEVAAAERDAARGLLPERPFVLVGQQYLADPTRSAGDRHPVWAYAHVPNGFRGDATEALVAQIERFAPGFRERVLSMYSLDPGGFEAYNANYVGGDILTGANTPWQLLARPRLGPSPYSTGIPGVYLCSAATPPGAGVHGMCGANAAASALRPLGRR